jgi:glycosyltransferase involved in cell wall biosynthesis
MLSENVALTIIIPALNEEPAIASTLDELRRRFPDAEVLVVDDGSTDGTGAKAAAVGGVRVLRHDMNRGYGAAIKTGVRHATNDIVAWFDADGQHTAENLDLLLRQFTTHELHAAIGARIRGSAVEGRRVLGKVILGFFVQFVAGRRLADVNCGLRVVRRSVLRRYLHLLPDGFSASITSMLLMLQRGYRVEFVPIVTRPRTGTSTVRPLRDGLLAIQTSLRILILFQAFHAFSVVATLLFVVGSTYGTAMALLFRRGFPALASVLVLSGVIIFFMGLLTDQVVALRMERLEENVLEDHAPNAGVS